MHREQKIGLGLGVLLVGVVAAFFFRNDPDPAEAPPRLEDTTIVDARISEKPVTPYLTGVEPAPADGPSAREAGPLRPPELARDGHPSDPFADLAPPPDPISPATTPIAARDPRGGPSSGTATGLPVPRHNNAWEVRPARTAAERTARTSAGPAAAGPNWRYHVVEKGDTLTGIAGRYLGSTGRFLEVYRYNQDVLANPNALQVGMKLRIPPVNGPPPEPPRAPSPPVPPGADGPTAETKPGETRPVSTGRPASSAADSAADPLWPPDGPGPPAAAPAPTKRFVPAPHSPLNPGPRRLSQVPPDGLPTVTP
ncbi:MAG: LysM domain-containing protein [Planctomycetales bacterium]